MIWAVRWSPVCNVDVLHMHYKTAERVCTAVMAWARDGFAKDLDPVDDGGGTAASRLFRLRVRGGFALVRVDESTMTLDVSRILPDKPTRRIVSLL